MMKFKSIFKPAAAVLAAAIALASCEVDTTTVMFEEDHNFSDPTDTVFSMLGIIGLVQEVAERNVVLGEVRGDLMAPAPLTADETLVNLANSEDLEDETYNRYRDYYAIINNCNFYLARADSAMERRGERVFLKEYAAVSAYRAWAYLWLAQIYGTVPFYTEPLLSYSDVERVMNDPSNRKGMADICAYFIDDLRPYVDTPYPQYGDFTYGEDQTIRSEYIFLPVRLLLGDLYLWRGSVTGNRTDFAEAAQCYRDYLVENDKFIFPSSVSAYRTSPSATSVELYRGWDGMSNSLGSALISVVPMAETDFYGRVGTLSTVFSSFNFLASESLKDLVENAYYCYAASYIAEGAEEGVSRFRLVEDTRYYGTPEAPVYLSYVAAVEEGTVTPEYATGDLRLYEFPTGNEYDMNVEGYNLGWPHVGTYRTNTVFLRLAEAINRAGYPYTAFGVLKYGLSRGNLVYYDKHGELSRLMQSGYTFYDFGDNTDNVGIHARGCGNAEMDTLHYTLPALASLEDSIREVENFLIDEMALESPYNGSRFFSLMRFALRRGDPSFLADRVARRGNPDMPDETLRNRLSNPDNWYLPMTEN